MSEQPTKICLRGLTALELAELKQELKRAGADASEILQADKEPSDVSGSRKGEPATMFIVLAVSQMVLTGLAIWMAKGRRHNAVRKEIEYENRNGEKFRYTVHATGREEDAIKADVIRSWKDSGLPRLVNVSSSGID